MEAKREFLNGSSDQLKEQARSKEAWQDYKASQLNDALMQVEARGEETRVLTDIHHELEFLQNTTELNELQRFIIDTLLSAFELRTETNINSKIDELKKRLKQFLRQHPGSVDELQQTFPSLFKLLVKEQKEKESRKIKKILLSSDKRPVKLFRWISKNLLGTDIQNI